MSVDSKMGAGGRLPQHWRAIMDRGICRQQKAMFYKRYLTSLRDLKGRFFETVVPVLVVAFVLLILKMNINPSGPELTLSPALFQVRSALITQCLSLYQCDPVADRLLQILSMVDSGLMLLAAGGK